MIRKLALAAIAAGTMLTGMLATAEDASAWHRRHGFTIYLGGGGYHGYHGYRHKHCNWVRVKRHGYWKTVKRCRWHRH